MSKDDREAEDVAGLFRKFGGDAKGYKEFEPAPEVGQPQGAWTLIPGSPAAQAAAIAAPALPAAAPEPAAAAAAPAPAPVSTPWAPAPSAVAASPTGTPRELDLLFARLAGQSQPAPEGGHGLMSRWRKPS
ncbi:hypothetical protein [Variovorax ginsengisoli]|jgi:hypothetical protein|uniref:Uncharacterized protein n=1 Tax=Variovorax ginsengisoli TaxID=363844 RepID=A0ABT8S933_9BURK|nr:hypothetical protein [Variovorax ginsengisoli]MDN8615823.1 hypothetical protein [Variovorax ginsengisoli]MDO1534993.1 hypothetical protein [Variovorax ginsengisoli]